MDHLMDLTLGAYLLAMFLFVMILPILATSIVVRFGTKSVKKTVRSVKKK